MERLVALAMYLCGSEGLVALEHHPSLFRDCSRPRFFIGFNISRREAE